ncbi:MAG: site-2 protease family protein, partial [Clostridia bacterium]|nr:site-2 protease family protein [Clostridia bacterium]
MLGSLTDKIIELLFVVPCVLFALTVHEVSHGYMAYRLGDPTARNMGRLTLNPMKHLDPVGTLCMILFHFGWARPVPINTRYFKKPRRDTALTAAAGPVSNFIIAFLGVLVQQILLAIFIR